MTRSVSRRDMLALLGAGLAITMTGALPSSLSAAARNVARVQGNAELDTWVTAQLGRADVRGIGSAWKARHPADSSPDALARAILSERRRGEPLPAYLSRVVVAEHAAGRAEPVDGWYLAPTEARLATLVDLVRAGTR